MMLEELMGPKGKPCPICLTPSNWDEKKKDEVGLSVNCHRCGHFKIDWILFQETYQNDQFIVEIADEKRHIVSSWIRERTIGEEPIIINGSTFNEAIKASELDFFAKAQRIMLSIRTRHPKVGEVFLGIPGNLWVKNS